jgi:hypothetical protein
MLGHSALLTVLAAGLVISPLGVAQVAGSEPAVPAPLVALVSRPQVDLEPFALWWSLMGTPAVVFADPTLDQLASDVAADELASTRSYSRRGARQPCPGGRSSTARSTRARTVDRRPWA